MRGGFGNLHALQADVEPCVVHHREHGAHPAEFGTDQFANTFAFFAKGQDAGRRRINAHLMFDRYHFDVILRADTAIFINPIFGYQKQRNALRPCGAIGRAGQHQMDDVFGHVMVAEADINLRAFDVIGTITARRCGRF